MTDPAVVLAMLMMFLILVFLVWLLMRTVKSTEQALQEHRDRIGTLEEAYARVLENQNRRRERPRCAGTRNWMVPAW